MSSYGMCSPDSRSTRLCGGCLREDVEQCARHRRPDLFFFLDSALLTLSMSSFASTYMPVLVVNY